MDKGSHRAPDFPKTPPCKHLELPHNPKEEEKTQCNCKRYVTKDLGKKEPIADAHAHVSFSRSLNRRGRGLLAAGAEFAGRGPLTVGRQSARKGGKASPLAALTVE